MGQGFGDIHVTCVRDHLHGFQLTRIGDPNQFPGPIDNSGLFDSQNGGGLSSAAETTASHPTLKERLCDELDYVLVPQEGELGLRNRQASHKRLPRILWPWFENDEITRQIWIEFRVAD